MVFHGSPLASQQCFILTYAVQGLGFTVLERWQQNSVVVPQRNGTEIANGRTLDFGPCIVGVVLKVWYVIGRLLKKRVQYSMPEGMPFYLLRPRTLRKTSSKRWKSIATRCIPKSGVTYNIVGCWTLGTIQSSRESSGRFSLSA